MSSIKELNALSKTPFVAIDASQYSIQRRGEEGHRPAQYVDRGQGARGREGVGHQTVEVEALGKHPGETTALKVDLQERQQLTANLLDLIIMMYMYLSIFAAYTCCCQSKLLDCSASLKWRYPLGLQLNFYSIQHSVFTFCIMHSTPITVPILSHILFILYYMYQIKSKRMNF